MATDYTPALSRRRLLKALGAAGVGLAAGGVGMAARGASAFTSNSSISFGVAPVDRAITTLGDNGYSVQAAGLAVNDQDAPLVDGTDRTRRVLYQYADRMGPYVDYLGDLAAARAEGRDFSYDRLIRAREQFNVYTWPIPQPRYYGLQRVWRAGERFGFGVLPGWDHGPWWGRPWPVADDFWGLIYCLDSQRTPWVWFIASTAEFRAISAAGASRAVRTEVVVQRSGPGQWMEYRAEQAILSIPLRRGPTEFFNYPTWL